MKRTTEPDRYSDIIQRAVRAWRRGLITPAMFGAIMHVILELRGARHV